MFEPQPDGYCWWTVRIWRERHPSGQTGIKLGPMSLVFYQWDGWQMALIINGRSLRAPVFDTGIWAHR